MKTLPLDRQQIPPKVDTLTKRFMTYMPAS